MPRKPKKDRTSLVISTVIHAALIGGIIFWAYKTGKLEQMRQAVLQYVKGEKKEEKKAEPPQQKQVAAPKLPPINQGMKAPESSGTRRAVASDAPEAHGGGTFFQDTRKQVEGPSTAGAGARQTNAPLLKPVGPPAPAPRPAFAPPPKTTVKQLLAERSKAAASVEAVGTEQISKSGSSDAGAVLTKVSGASIVDGKFAVIRGLTDRYVSTTLNSAEIPSADPYRRSASLDQFPSQIIDKVVVTKTFTPDQPGTSAGGGINIVTKAFPSAPFANVSIGTAYNSQATFNDNFLTYEGGDLDWLGMDDGTRAIPDSLADMNADIPVGLPNQGNPQNPNFANLIAQAETIAQPTRDLGVTQFAPTRDAPPMDRNFSLAAGDTAFLFDMPMGVLATLNYRREFRFQEDEVSRRWNWDTGNPVLSRDFTDSVATDTVNWSAMGALTLQPFPDHEVGVNYLFNQNGQSIAREQEGFSDSQPTVTIFTKRLQWIERNLQTLQFKGTDRFPELGHLRLDWIVGLTSTSQDEPDTRFFNYAFTGIDYRVAEAWLPNPKDPTRYFRDLSEENTNPRLDLTLPFHGIDSLPGEVKAGWLLSNSERSLTERQFFYKTGAPRFPTYTPPGFDGDPNHYLKPDNLGYIIITNSPTLARIHFMRYAQNADSLYDAETEVQAAYAMMDFPIAERLRLIGGARFESTDIHIDSVSWIANSVTGLPVNQTDLNQTDVLPAVGLVYAINSNLNLRLNYSETIARPSVRELAAIRSYDPVLDVEIDGNPELQISAIKNYDLRLEWFPRPGEIYSFTLFYKSLTDPIELYSTTADDKLLTYVNRETGGKTWGVEFEARKVLDFVSPLLSDFSIGGNLALIQSETPLSGAEYTNRTSSLGSTPRERPMYDTSPYLVNADLSYDNIPSGTSASLVFNIAGPRIAFASQTKEDVYEQPAPLLDFIFSQRIGRSLTFRFTAKNLLNPVIKRTYGENEEDFTFPDPNTSEPRTLPNLYSTSRRGLTFGVSLSYDF